MSVKKSDFERVPGLAQLTHTREDLINALYRLKFRSKNKRIAQLVYPNVRDTGFDSRRL